MTQKRSVLSGALLAGLIVLGAGGPIAFAWPGSTARAIFGDADSEIVRIDPITTGSRVSLEQLREWESRKADFERCGLCGEAQPFPGDLPKS